VALYSTGRLGWLFLPRAPRCEGGWLPSSLSAWREGIASRQRRRARPHLRSASSTSSDSEDGSQPPSQRGALGKNNQPRRPVEYSATSQIELRELIASEVESLRSSGEEVDKTSVRFRRKHDRHVENPRHSLSPKSTSQPLISLDGPHISIGDPSTRISELNHRQPKGPIPSGSPLLSPPTNSHAQNLVQTVQKDETTHIRTPPVPERSSTPGPIDLLTPTPMGVGVSSPNMGLPGSSEVLSFDQYLTSRDQTLSPQSFISSNLSTELLSSPFYSPPASPFIPAMTYRGSAELPTDGSAQLINTPGGIIYSPVVIERPLPPLPVVSADSDVFSLLSQVSSDTDSDEGDYDSASMLGSEMSSWASDAAYGEGTTQHA